MTHFIKDFKHQVSLSLIVPLLFISFILGSYMTWAQIKAMKTAVNSEIQALAHPLSLHLEGLLINYDAQAQDLKAKDEIQKVLNKITANPNIQGILIKDLQQPENTVLAQAGSLDHNSLKSLNYKIESQPLAIDTANTLDSLWFSPEHQKPKSQHYQLILIPSEKPIHNKTQTIIITVLMISIIGLFTAILLATYLGKRIVARNNELAEAHKAAEQASRAKSDFLARMSHEIRTPLHAISGFSQLIAQQHHRHNKDIQKFNKIIQLASKQIISVIGDILNYSRFDPHSGTHNITLQHKNFNLHEQLQSSQAMFQPNAEKKQLTFKLEIEDDVPKYIQSDPERLAQIINNLLSNALKFTTQGEISLRANRIKQNTHDYLCLTISDTGIGIAQDKQHSIFKAFQQADNSITRRFGGTGLGLAISKNLITLMQGDIQLKSTPNKGSTFTVTLPLVSADLRVATETDAEDKNLVPLEDEPDNPLRPQHPLKILVAEDDEFNRELLANYLKDWNTEIDYVGDGKQAVQAVRKKDYDVILLDWHMPEMHGLDAAVKIRKEKPDAHHALLLLTADAQAEKIQHHQQFDSYLVKPISQQRLLKTLCEVLKNKAKQKKASPNIACTRMPKRS